MERHADRCGVYEWFFAELKRQNEDEITVDRLARERLRNVANKLVAHHRASPQSEYAAEIRYLIFSGTDPVHFSFAIRATDLEALLRRTCP